MATPQRRSSRIKGETPVSKYHWQLSQHSFAPLLHLFHGPGIHTDRAIVSLQRYALSKQAILSTRAGRVSCKRRPTLPQHPCLLTSRPSKYRNGARSFRWSAIASQNTPDGFAHTAIFARNAPKQSSTEYYQIIIVSSRLRQYLFSVDRFSFKAYPHSAPSADTIKIEGLFAGQNNFAYLRL